MTILTYVALTGCLLVLGLGAATMIAERGYHFDLRSKARRRGITPERRASDRAIKAPAR
ncbi:MAG: hypothetical protein AAF721_15130 [Myxococcota bacterium]